MREGQKFERKIRSLVRDESGFTCEKRDVFGGSGNIWEVDGVIFAGESPVSYLEIKYVGGKSSYTTQLKLAFAQLADFSYANIPGAVVVPDKRNTGEKDWESYLATIGCVLIDERTFGDFIDSLQDFPTAPEASDPLEDFISDAVTENLGDEDIRFPTQNHGMTEKQKRLRDIGEKYSEENRE